MSIGGELRLRVTANPGLIASLVMKKGLYDAYIDSLLEATQEFQENSPVGATRDLKNSWDVTAPRRESVTFDINASIVNYSASAINRIAGRGAGKMPFIGEAGGREGILPWVIAKGIELDPKKARAISFAIAKKIEREGTERYKAKDNWVGINSDGSRIPGGRLEEVEKAIAQKLGESSKQS